MARVDGDAYVLETNTLLALRSLDMCCLLSLRTRWGPAGDEEGGGGSELPSLRVRRLSLPGKNSGSPASADLGHGAVPSHTAESLSSPRPPVSTRLPSTPETDESFLHTDISSFFCSLSAEVNGTSVCVSSSTAEGDVTQYGETSCSSPPVSSPTAANPLQNPSLVLTTPPNRSGLPPAFPCSSAAQNCERSDVSKPACPGPLPLSKSASPSSFSREDLSFGHGRCRPPTLSSHAVAPVLWSPLCGGKSCNDETNEKEELFLFFGGGRGCQTFCDVWLFSPSESGIRNCGPRTKARILVRSNLWPQRLAEVVTAEKESRRWSA